MLGILKQMKHEFEIFSRKYLEKQNVQSLTLKNAMMYGMLGGGKRIRALLSLVSGKCFNCNYQNSLYIAFAVEAIHTYSLIHDDLPAMDNDALRRGKSTCHIKFGEATAILAADALQSLAFQALSELQGVNIQQFQKILNTLAVNIGSQGMIGGQNLDISAQGRKLNVKKLEEIHHLKTGKLLSAAILMPFIASSYHKEYLIKKHLVNFCRKIGIAFQIKDDLLEVTSDTKALGKSTNSDTKLDKLTYPSLLGIESSEKHLKDCFTEAMHHYQNLRNFDSDAYLKAIILYIVNRKH